MSNSYCLTEQEACSILGVTPAANVVEIKRSFVKLSLKCHPDKAGSSPEAHAKYIRIVSSKDLLMKKAQMAPNGTVFSSLEYDSPRTCGSGRSAPSTSCSFSDMPPLHRTHSSLNPQPRNVSHVPVEDVIQLWKQLTTLKGQHEILTQQLSGRMAKGLEAECQDPEDAKTSQLFESGFRCVGAALGDAIGRLHRLPPGPFGQEMVSLIDRFTKENEDFFSIVQSVLEQSTETRGKDTVTQGPREPLKLELLMTLAHAPIPPVYYTIPACWWLKI